MPCFFRHTKIKMFALVILVFLFPQAFSYCPKFSNPSWGFQTFDGINDKFCYLYSSSVVNWNDARYACPDDGHMVSIHDAFTNSLLACKKVLVRVSGVARKNFWGGPPVGRPKIPLLPVMFVKTFRFGGGAVPWTPCLRH